MLVFTTNEGTTSNIFYRKTCIIPHVNLSLRSLKETAKRAINSVGLECYPYKVGFTR